MAIPTSDADLGGERIDFRERHETQLWMQALDVDEKTRRKAVSVAGTRVENVRLYLQQHMKQASLEAKRAASAAKSARTSRSKPTPRSKAIAKKRPR